MRPILRGTTAGLADVESFVERIDELPGEADPELRGFFDPEREIAVTRAPGRLDVMGGIADYSGSLVLELPLAEATIAGLQRVTERELWIVSLAPGGAGPVRSFKTRLSALEEGGGALGYDQARRWFARDAARRWAAYAAGGLLVLAREKGVRFSTGARILVSSSVPEGKGVSSSAALEVAVLEALAAAFEVPLSPRELALLAQKVENLVAGAPCGVMDQMTCACGEAGKLLELLCQPAELQGQVAVPEDVAFWGIDSGLRHAVSGADYGSVRTGAFMGLRILRELAGEEPPPWREYLANLSPSEFETRHALRLPETIGGREFLERYGETGDPVTRVDPEGRYAVRVPAAHPVYEHFRVSTFAELLRGPPGPRRLELLGELMYQSHASYSACGLDSDGTDRLVELARALGPGRGFYGAKITGGGSGGTVAVLGRRDAGEAVREVAERYAAETGREPVVFSGSSPGSRSFGVLRLGPAER